MRNGPLPIRATIQATGTLNAEYWLDYEDGARKRCAEVLVPNELQASFIDSVVVQNPSVLQNIEAAVPWRILVRPDWFF